KKLAKELQIGICATYLSKTEQNSQNTAIIIDRKGEIILDYAKVHTCDFSLEILLQSGEEFKVCEFDGIKLGVMICYDREFPESARVLMLKGAEI
ncbi:carbon-nitrogen hydrolase family protein, partial [Escherichia coli]|nr:carbon-nitrogen hydrolase family protein [Escherichia coli]